MFIEGYFQEGTNPVQSGRDLCRYISKNANWPIFTTTRMFPACFSYNKGTPTGIEPFRITD